MDNLRHKADVRHRMQNQEMGKTKAQIIASSYQLQIFVKPVTSLNIIVFIYCLKSNNC